MPSVGSRAGRGVRSRTLLPVLTAAAGLLVVAVPLPSSAQGPPEPPQAPASSDRGRFLYLRDCAYCHDVDGGGTARGPTLRGVGAAAVDFMLSTGRMPVDAVVRQADRRPSIYDRRQIDAIVRHVMSIDPSGPRVPDVDPDAGDLGHGAGLYLLNCAACHGATGDGAVLTDARFSPSLRRSTPTEIGEAVIFGPTWMPVFSPPLSAYDVDSIARYVLYLHRPADRGGDPLWHLGPVAEGLVAWFVGIGLLLVVVRWIGTRDAP